MNGNENISPGEVASNYIQENFQPDDRLAVVLIHKRTKAVLQRLGGKDRSVGLSGLAPV